MELRGAKRASTQGCFICEFCGCSCSRGRDISVAWIQGTRHEAWNRHISGIQRACAGHTQSKRETGCQDYHFHYHAATPAPQIEDRSLNDETGKDDHRNVHRSPELASGHQFNQYMGCCLPVCACVVRACVWVWVSLKSRLNSIGCASDLQQLQCTAGNISQRSLWMWVRVCSVCQTFTVASRGGLQTPGHRFVKLEHRPSFATM